MKRKEYEISEDGVVTEVGTNKKLWAKKSSKGDLYIKILDPRGIKRRMSITRLVAFAFVSNPNNYSNVKHKDGDLLNNNADNLEWVESAFDIDYLDETPVECIETGVIYNNAHAAAQAIWGYAPSIFKAASGECKTAAGCHWKFIKGED